MLRWLLIVPLLVVGAAFRAPPGDVPPVQSGQFVQTAVGDWLGGGFNGIYVEGGDLRLQPGSIAGAYESKPLQTPFGLNAAVLQWHLSATAGQTLTLELRSSVDGQSWTDWQAAASQSDASGGTISQLFTLRPFTSWLQYRARFEATNDSPLLNDVTLTYLSSTAGPSLVDIVGRVPAAGPLVKTPPPDTVAATDWGALAPGADIIRQRPRRVIVSEVRAAVDDPNSAATIRALQWVATNLLGRDFLPYHFLIDGAGTIFQGVSSATVRVPDHPAGDVVVGLLADSQRDGVSEATQAALGRLLGWLGDAYMIGPSSVDVAAGAPDALRKLGGELRTAMDRATVRSRLFFAAGNTALGTERLTLFNRNADEARATLTSYSSLGQDRRSIAIPSGKRVDLPVNSTFSVNGPIGLELVADRVIDLERTQIVGKELFGGTAIDRLARTWYFADASGVGGDGATLNLLNPQPREVQATVTAFPDAAAPVSRTLTLAPRSQQDLLLNRLLAGQRFAVRVVATEGIVAEQTTLATAGAASAAAGVAEISRRWMFAEGSTMQGYTTTLALFNPWPQQVVVSLRVSSEDGTSLERRYALAGEKRTALTLNDIVPALPFAMDLTAERPLVAERLMGFDNGRGASIGPGARAPATRWTFVEGATVKPAQEFLLVLNPNSQPVQLDVGYILADGRVEHRKHAAGAGSRLTISVNADMPDQPILSATVVAERPVVVDRTIYVVRADGRAAETSLGIPGN